ncbi:unnamed protein product [Lactuca virosa]|uniref:C2H2-type domain-containing protein n=1 Tax=Lactuca virosa TaxID=75947 RepID=A0AAU9M5A5_9ASTR|nr:unnamed protein product [Lactuca virosa]
MLDPDESHHFPAGATAVDSSSKFPMDTDGRHQQLINLSKLQSRMDHVQRFLSDSLNTNTIIGESQMEIVSKEITSAINQVIVNGAALLSCTGLPKSKSETPNLSVRTTSLTFDSKHSPESDLILNHLKHDVDLGVPKTEVFGEEIRDDDWDIVELDAVELLAEHLHFCELCGKGFKRDANLRMHMRAHGNKFKTLEALSKPEKSGLSSSSELTRGGRTRFSCPFAGCTRNKLHKKFRPLKSVICVKNHFKRSHCPKMYSCNRCHKKNFSVLADLKSHLKHCGEIKWKCSCGTSFSRKDKLFGHMALFEGHMPAMPEEVVVEEDEKAKGVAVAPAPAPALAAVVVEDAEGGGGCKVAKGMDWIDNTMDDGFFDGLGSLDDDFCMQELLVSSNGCFDWNS